jgi:DNA modification methylase
MIQLHHGDCLDVLRTMPDASVDAIVTDPPYGLRFMGKKWDYDVPTTEVWAECLRVLKPGGHLLAFAGTRTQHRMAVRIEDAGFEIRDMIAWVYGSGFPKSLDVSKAIDKVNGEAGRLHKFTAWMRTTGLTRKQINDATGTFMGSHYMTDKSQPAIPTPELWAKLRPLCGDVPAWVDELVDRIEADREVVGFFRSSLGGTVAAGERNADYIATHKERTVPLTAPATDAARQWQGWGTALKPALEPITMARKPLEGAVAANVLQWGTGGINVDGCRVEMGSEYDPKKMQRQKKSEGSIVGAFGAASLIGKEIPKYKPGGRWPSNLLHDGSDEAVGLFPDAGKESAARFFYTAKADAIDRNDGLSPGERNAHPTVKPVDLMCYLCRLVTPPGGIVLDPFMGSGSTGKACVTEGFSFIGIERDADSFATAQARVVSPMPLFKDVL